MNRVLETNVGALLTLRTAQAFSTATAGAGSNNAVESGIIIDRLGIGMPKSAKLAVLYTAHLQSGQTLSVGLDLQSAEDGTTFSDYASAASAVVATGPSGGGVVTGQVILDVNLTSAQRYLQTFVTPNLNASGTDTVSLTTVLVFGGEDALPAVA